MTSTRIYQFTPSCCHMPNNSQYVWKNVCSSTSNIVEDKRLLLRSNIDLPTYLKLGRKIQFNLIKVKKRRLKEDYLAGYNPYRGDFETEFNNKAECLVVLASELNNICHKSDDANESKKEELNLIKHLQIALGEQYTSQLKERDKRKAVIKRHGLMNQKGTAVWFSRLEATLGKTQTKRIIHLCPLTNADEIEQLSSCLGLINMKRAEINKLIFYRTQRGITTKWDMGIFEIERHKREIKDERVDIRNLATPQVVKRKKTCSDIFHFPRYKELSPKEADLCRSNGLKPSFFLEIKDFLISDCKRNNGLLLKKARKIVKIDVNKTRKIFDLLLEEGFIWFPDENLN